MLRAHLLRGCEQGRRIQVENGLGVGLVAELRVVAAHRENIAYAERRGPEQLGLQRNAVPVATGDLQNGLDAASHQKVRRRETRHVRSRSRAVGHIDRGGEPAQRERVVDEFGGVGGHRRGKLGGDDETSVLQVPLQLADGATR